MLLFRQISAVAAKELKILWRDRQALALLFAMPVFFILVMSIALEGVFEAGTRERPLNLMVVNRDPGELGRRVVAALEKIDGLHLVKEDATGILDVDRAEQAIRRGKQRFAVVFEPEFSARIQGTERISNSPIVRLIVDPAVNRPMQSIVTGMITGAVEQIRLAVQLPEEFDRLMEGVKERLPVPVLAESALADSAADFAGIQHLLTEPERRIAPEIVAPEGYGQSRKPTSTEQNVPAYAIFGVFFIVLTIAKSFLRERTDGTLIRLKTAPLPKWVLIAGKMAPYFLVNLLQIGLMFAIGVGFFAMNLGNFPAFALVSFAVAASANGLGLLVAAVGGSEARVDTLAVLMAITLAALGGVMVPAYVMPEALQTVSRATPHAWALAAYQDVIVRGLGVPEVLPECGVLLALALGFGLAGLWRLRLE